MAKGDEDELAVRAPERCDELYMMCEHDRRAGSCEICAPYVLAEIRERAEAARREYAQARPRVAYVAITVEQAGHLRDAAAVSIAAALVGGRAQKREGTPGARPTFNPAEIAAVAWDVAEALVAEREKRGGR